jgi:hypothetical protein
VTASVTATQRHGRSSVNDNRLSAWWQKSRLMPTPLSM